MHALLQELQLTVYQMASASAGLQALVGTHPDGKGGVVANVFDHVPQTATVPYVVMDSFSSLEDGDKSAIGERATWQMHVWSDNRSNLQVSKIVAVLKALYHGVTLRISDGSQAINVKLADQKIIPDSDGIHRQAVLRFTTLLREDNS